MRLLSRAATPPSLTGLEDNRTSVPPRHAKRGVLPFLSQPSNSMKRFWLLFSQTVTVFVAAYFVVATLQPDWLQRGAMRSGAGIALIEAPATTLTQPAPGSLSSAAGWSKVCSPKRRLR